MAWLCVNSFGTELIFETEPHKAVYSWRDDYGSCKCIDRLNIWFKDASLKIKKL